MLNSRSIGKVGIRKNFALKKKDKKKNTIRRLFYKGGL